MAQGEGGGRPTKYDPKVHPALAQRLVWLGANNEEIAEAMQIGISTFKVWVNTYKKFRAAIRFGKEYANSRVAKSMYRRALGYEYEEKHTEIIDAGEGKTIRKVKSIKRRVPPDPQAAAFWLRNRDPKNWSDKQIVQHEGGDKPIGVNLEHEALVLVIRDGSTNDLADAFERQLAGVSGGNGQPPEQPALEMGQPPPNPQQGALLARHNGKRKAAGGDAAPPRQE